MTATKKPKRQRRWCDLSDIDKAIDAGNRKKLKLRQQAQTCYDAAEMEKGINDVEYKKLLEEGDRLIAKASRLEHTRIKKLSNLRAEFLTVPIGAIAGVDGLTDNAAVLQSVVK